jgi:hypothetical protein
VLGVIRFLLFRSQATWLPLEIAAGLSLSPATAPVRLLRAGIIFLGFTAI